MRLINVHNHEIREFHEGSIPRYAILSHTWGEPEDEVTFQDMEKLRQSVSTSLSSSSIEAASIEIRRKPGLEKILFTCQQAKEDDLDWAWVDTCCIDKTSSAELDESITSMYRWYEQSTQCYAYLSDVPDGLVGDLFASRLRASRWITRGWTLQELIAPWEVKFFGLSWKYLGTRSSYRTVIHDITRIPKQLLKCDPGNPFSDPRHYSAAQKMSWAAGRKCKKVEDVAYCLLGLFDIYMPLHYGERSRAFVRLQEEILRKTDDHSLFAWTGTAEDGLLEYQMSNSIFATSPLNFINSGDIVVFHEELGPLAKMTTHGVKIRLPMEQGMGSLIQTHPVSCGRPVLRAVLNCGQLAPATKRRLNPGRLPKFCSEDRRIVLLLVETKESYRGLSKLRCYSRLVTSQHVGVHDKTQFRCPSCYETMFLNTNGNYPRNHRTDVSFDRPISRNSRFILMYQATQGTESSQGCLPYRVNGARKLHYETGRWEQRPFFPGKIETFEGPYLQRMEMRGNQLEPLEFWFGVEQRRPGVNTVHICLKTTSKSVRPDRSSLSFVLTGSGGPKTECHPIPCSTNLCVGSSLFSATMHCTVGDIDDVVKLCVEFSVRPRIAASQHESGGRELIAITSIGGPNARITSEGGKLMSTTGNAPETTRKRGLSEMFDGNTQKRQRWRTKWFNPNISRTDTAVIPKRSAISMESNFVLDPSTDTNSGPTEEQFS